MKKALNWLYENWMKATPFLAIYVTIILLLYVKEYDFALFLIRLQTPIYWAHEFEEYVCPGGFLDFFNRNPMRSKLWDYPLTKIWSFWINIPLVYIAMPIAWLMAHFISPVRWLWAAYFSFLNAFSHVVFFFIYKFKYNPGLVVSILLNIPFAIYTVYYFVSNWLTTVESNIIRIIVWIIAQASMMVYGFWYLVPKLKKEGLRRD